MDNTVVPGSYPSSLAGIDIPGLAFRQQPELIENVQRGVIQITAGNPVVWSKVDSLLADRRLE